MNTAQRLIIKPVKNTGKKPIRIKMKSMKMEFAVWMAFFGLGIAYFVWAIIISFC